MAKIILLSQKVTKAELLSSISGKKIGKIFFQCVLKDLKDDVATFGLVAYAAKKEKSGLKKWNIGTPVYCQPDPKGKDEEINPADYKEPIAFGNMEVQLQLEEFLFEEVDPKLVMPNKDKMANFILLLNKLPKETGLLFKGGVSKNPHIEYTVAIEGTTSGADANPCPPNQPGDN